MSKNIRRSLPTTKQSVAPPLEYYGQWIMWNADRTAIIAHAPTLEEADRLARLQGFESFVAQKLPRIDSVFIGAL